MEGKTAKDSSLITVTVISSQDVNLSGNVFGGVIMKLIDTVAASVAFKHSRAKA
ncbi:MAG: hypothetical protein JW901_00515 [Dehalococcoidia bacterium]|nr:hypothetical protein [Dehalococcoidia bacterium]